MLTRILTAAVTGTLATVLFVSGCAAQKGPQALTGREEKKDQPAFVRDAAGRTVPNVAQADHR